VCRIVAAIEPVVGDAELARPRVIREDPGADVLEAIALDGQPRGAGDELRACQDGDLGAAERQALEGRRAAG
jgi:hypothetical protein